MAADTSRLKVRAGMAAGAMLLAISSYNVLPTLNRAIHGEVAAIGLAVVQIAFTVILAIIPFVPGWDAGTRRWLTVAFMLVNGYFAYENAGHRHDGERTANKQHEAIVAELAAKQDALKKLGDFTVTEDSQIEIARKNADTADADKTVAKTSVNAARTQLAGGCDTPKKCKVIEDEVKRAEAEAKQKDEDARKAHEELQRLSGWRTLTKKAEPINTRVDELQRALDQEHVVSDTSSKSEAVRTIEALFIAAVIELGNRFGPEGIFKFIFFASGVPLFLSAAPVTADADSDMEDKPENVRSVSTSKDPTSPPSRRTRKKRTPKGRQDVCAQVIRFPKAEDARALITEGKTQKEAAKMLGVSDRTVRRWLSSLDADSCPAEYPGVSGQDTAWSAA